MSLVNTGLLMAGMFIAKGVDWEMEGRVEMLRMVWMASQGIALVAVYMVYRGIMALSGTKDAKRVLKVAKVASFADPQPKGFDSMSLEEYDMKQFKEMCMATLLPMVIIAVMHFKYEAILPLVTTSIMTFTRLQENKLVRIHVLGQSGAELERPFKVEENPLAKMMREATEEPQEEQAAVDAPNKKKSKKQK